MSRLDRLVVLLETGSTPFIRNTAADQLSDLAKGHPEETLNLLGRVYPFLKSNRWETRISAARAFGGIVNYSHVWDPNDEQEQESSANEARSKSENPTPDVEMKTEDDNSSQINVKSEDNNSQINVKTEDDQDNNIKIKQEDEEFKLEQDEELKRLSDNLSYLVTFESWNLIEILKSNKKLLAASLNEIDSSHTNHDDDEDSLLNKFKRHKNNIIKTEEDASQPSMNESNGDPDTQSNIKTEESTKLEDDKIDEAAKKQSSASNARLKAMQKRRAKANAKAGINRSKPIDLSQSSVSRKMMSDSNNLNGDSKPDGNQFDITTQQGGEKLVLETKTSEFSPILNQHAKVAGLVWQFQGVYELLVNDLFDDKWEIRHGACLGLRELIKKHGKSAGRVKKATREENDHNNNATLEDLAVRLCTLFALDRFGDYVSDTVVAPVRESGAQTLAALLIYLEMDPLLKTFDALNKLVLQEGYFPKCWEAKHGGMLGLRYFVSVRTNVLQEKTELLNDIVSVVLHGLKESDDDVQSVAALTLSPIANDFIQHKKELIHVLLITIWDCLINLRDDLSASIGSVMDLLAKLCTHKEVIDIMEKQAENDPSNSFEALVPRLFPFLRHSIVNVRKAVLRTMLEFLSIDNSSTKKWISSKALRLVFQNLLVEQNDEVLILSEKVYNGLLAEVNKSELIDTIEVLFKSNYSPLLTLIMTPIGIPRHSYRMDTSLIIRPSGQVFGTNDPHSRRGSHSDASGYEDESFSNNNQLEARGRKRKSSNDTAKSASAVPILDDMRVNIDAPIFSGDVLLVGTDSLIKTRIMAAKAFGNTLSGFTDNELLQTVLKSVSNYLKARHSSPKLFAAMIVQEYTKNLVGNSKEVPNFVKETFSPILMQTLSDPVHPNLPYYRELVPTLKALRASCMQLFNVFVNTAKISQQKIPQLPVVVQGEAEAGPNAFGIENAEKLITETYNKLLKSLSPTYKMTAIQGLEDAKDTISMAIDHAKSARSARTTSILAVYAAAILSIDGIPGKLNPIIRSLMDSIKLEESALLQKRSAEAVAHLIDELLKVDKQSVSGKIIKNLCGFLCVDTSEVPEFHHNIQFKTNILSLKKEEAKTDPTDIAEHEKAVFNARIKRQGALVTLDALINVYHEQLFDKVPKLKELMIEPLKLLEIASTDEVIKDEIKGQSIIDALGILRALLPKLDKSIYQVVLDQLPLLLPGFTSEFSVYRYSTAKGFATIAATCPAQAFTFLVKSVLPMLSNAGSVRERQGAIETVYHVSNTMGSDILPYVVFLIVPVLGRMSDSDPDVRILATTTFASIIRLVPLEAGIPDPEDMPKELLEGRDRERDFIQQMMDPSKIKPFDLPVSIKATLRKYQQEGVNWLHFLNRYHLHGVLCDDMGLGKTLQTICIMASDHYIRNEKYQETKSAEFRRLPSLVICPPSVTGHWEQEILQYAPFLSVLVYSGNPAIRSTLRNQVGEADIVVTSYDVSRNDADFLSESDFNYCILDEGHIIKNSASKLTKSVKRIRAEHRLILSGTPIQNNVLELWSLFDFLMPGFLGTEKVFNDKFAKPIAVSRNSKTTSKEQEAGAIALESLHKQVLPFMLRRLKEEVLSDLPPKIIQDYFCELSDLQKRLYRDFATKQKSSIEQGVKDIGENESDSKSHVFQALQYMRKLCNHPALVLSPQHPQYAEISSSLQAKKSSVMNIEHSPKLVSLKTLLLECGIGVTDSDYSSTKYKQKQKQQLITAEGVISEHRALIFCQLKDMCDIIENELLKKHLPSVTYMRLDGGTEARDRQKIVRKFNEDPSIDVLLLTTKVGGLGLNLTGADTVIFVEHDWNPMNDLQAMDRAHRLGQKKVVNVYRLITQNTLESKIMGLQKFKMNIASTIINQQNAGLSSMDTNQLLDLFDVQDNGNRMIENDDSEKDNKDVTEEVSGGLTGKAADAVGELGDLWDEAQYDDEYNLDNFIKTLK